MPYFDNPEQIITQIEQYCQAKTLWIDTEVADYLTSKPRLSLIQVLDLSTDFTGDTVAIFDVLNYPQLVAEFIQKIIINSAIEKVFHNASYDLQLLGGSRQAQGITCTLKMAQKIPYYLIPLPNLQLKTLAEQLCHFPTIEKTEQTGDWGQRPLTESQLEYAKLDVVYVAQVHHRLLQLSQLIKPDPVMENIEALALRYRQIEPQWKLLDTEVQHLKERIKAAMVSQSITEKLGIKLSSYKKNTRKVNISELVKLAQSQKIELDFNINLTKTIQSELGGLINHLPIEEKISNVSQLKFKDLEDEELPF